MQRRWMSAERCPLAVPTPFPLEPYLHVLRVQHPPPPPPPRKWQCASIHRLASQSSSLTCVMRRKLQASICLRLPRQADPSSRLQGGVSSASPVSVLAFGPASESRIVVACMPMTEKNRPSHAARKLRGAPPQERPMQCRFRIVHGHLPLLPHCQKPHQRGSGAHQPVWGPCCTLLV